MMKFALAAILATASQAIQIQQSAGAVCVKELAGRLWESFNLIDTDGDERIDDNEFYAVNKKELDRRGVGEQAKQQWRAYYPSGATFADQQALFEKRINGKYVTCKQLKQMLREQGV